MSVEDLPGTFTERRGESAERAAGQRRNGHTSNSSKAKDRHREPG